jgi:hypothetical protein
MKSKIIKGAAEYIEVERLFLLPAYRSHLSTRWGWAGLRIVRNKRKSHDC